MPIINMTHSREDAEARGTNVRSCENETIWLYDSHVGLCLADYERNGRDDSDWYMIVWNPAKGETEQIEFASTRGWSYPCYGSAPDATEEVLAAANDKARRDAIASATHDMRKDARRPLAGRTVRIVKGRKLALGTTWLVQTTAQDGYKRVGPFGSAPERDYALGSAKLIGGGRPLRLNLIPLGADGQPDYGAKWEWTAEGNVEVLDPERYEKPVEEIERRFAGFTKWAAPAALSLRSK